MRFAWLNRSFVHAAMAIGLIAGPALARSTYRDRRKRRSWISP